MELDLKKIASLRFEYQIVFAALTCEKMIYIIKEYISHQNTKRISIFEEALESLYSIALSFEYNADEIRGLVAEIEEFSPDLDESEDEIAPYALDACVSFVESLHFALDKKFEHLSNCSTAAIDTVDMFVQMTSEVGLPPMPELNNFIHKNSFMIKEIKRQNLIARELSKLKELNIASINKLREVNSSNQIINLSMI